jgi:hypothetical protein
MADKVTEIEVVSQPEGYEKTDYQFFLNKTTGQLWKALVAIQQAHSPIINGDIEAAPTQLAVQVSVSPVDKDGKALRDEEKPIIIDTLSHTFTHVEMGEEDFDPTKRIMAIIAERIHVGEARLDGVKKIKELGEAWSKKAKIKFSGSFKYIEAEAPKPIDDDTVDIKPNGPPVRAPQPSVGFADGSEIIAPAPSAGNGPSGADTGQGS